MRNGGAGVSLHEAWYSCQQSEAVAACKALSLNASHGESSPKVSRDDQDFYPLVRHYYYSK